MESRSGNFYPQHSGPARVDTLTTFRLWKKHFEQRNLSVCPCQASPPLVLNKTLFGVFRNLNGIKQGWGKSLLFELIIMLKVSSHPFFVLLVSLLVCCGNSHRETWNASSVQKLRKVLVCAAFLSYNNHQANSLSKTTKFNAMLSVSHASHIWCLQWRWLTCIATIKKFTFMRNYRFVWICKDVWIAESTSQTSETGEQDSLIDEQIYTDQLHSRRDSNVKYILSDIARITDSVKKTWQHKRGWHFLFYKRLVAKEFDPGVWIWPTSRCLGKLGWCELSLVGEVFLCSEQVQLPL